jgi:hypothetical protein
MSQRKKKAGMSLNDAVLDAVSKDKYNFVVKKPNGKWETTPRKLSGYKLAWGKGAKANPSIIYVPSLRLSGTEADIREYLATYPDVPKEHVDGYIATAFTADNYESEDEQHYIIADDSESGQRDVRGTYNDNFQAELAGVAAATSLAKEKAGPKGFDFTRINELASLVGGSADDDEEGDEKGATSPKKKKGARKSKPLVERLKEAFDAGKAFNISNTTSEGGKAVAGSRDKVPQNAIFLSADDKRPEMAAAYFSKTAAIEGPVNFLTLAYKMDKADATTYVTALKQASSRPAGGIPAPVGARKAVTTPARAPAPASRTVAPASRTAAPSSRTAAKPVPRPVPKVSGGPSATIRAKSPSRAPTTRDEKYTAGGETSAPPVPRPRTPPKSGASAQPKVIRTGAPALPSPSSSPPTAVAGLTGASPAAVSDVDAARTTTSRLPPPPEGDE